MWRFGFIGDILRWMLDWIYSVVPNYAIAILIFVVIIRMLIMPLDVKSRRGMRRTMAIQPKIKEIEKKDEETREAEADELV
jgi:YidC/Oxa1 family membrane protein insertase